MPTVRVAVNGAGGRMGQRILSIAATLPEFQVVGAFEYEKSPWVGKDLVLSDTKSIKIEALTAHSLKDRGILIDFSSPAGTLAAVTHTSAAGWGLVIGTTGLDDSMLDKIKKFSETMPIVHSSNMSIGVNLILSLVSKAAASLGKDYDIEITEGHHRHKKDSPSGTALMLAEAIAQAKRWDLKKVLKYRHEGKSENERSHEEIGMQVIRAGEIVGDHTVLFAGSSETIEITHRAQSRDAFARGSLVAAAFLADKSKGLFNMGDVLK